MMGRAELEQAKWECERWAEAYAAQERELRDLAATCEQQWQHKKQQLELARAARRACGTVRTSQGSLSREVEAFAAKVASALVAPSARQGLVSDFQGADGEADGAVAEAQRLVEALEAESGSLRASVDDYSGRADQAAGSARECWENARRLQFEIDICAD